MNAETILVPTDFSSCGDAALKYATALAHSMGAKLLIVHVEEPPLAYGGGEMYYGIAEPDQKEIERMLAAVRPTRDDVPHESRIITGAPADAIVDLAAEVDADMIVMGTHGRTGLGRLLMGSVAELVVRRAGCPVLTVRQSSDVATA
jgi:universal stress protein A